MSLDGPRPVWLDSRPMPTEPQRLSDEHPDTMPAALRTDTASSPSALSSKRTGLSGYVKLAILLLVVLVVASSLQQQSRRAAEKRDPAKEVAARRTDR